MSAMTLTLGENIHKLFRSSYQNMFDLAAAIIILLTNIYFLLLGSAAIFRPAVATRFLHGFASSARDHYLELAIRIVVGLAFLQYSRHVEFSYIFAVFGAILLATTFVLLFIPWKLHRRFAEKSVPKALPYLIPIGVISLLFGILLFAALVRSVYLLCQ